MSAGNPTFRQSRRIYLGDTTIDAELRLDAVARFLQDVAADHASSAHLPPGHAWILRRTALDVTRNPKLYEDVEITTGCSGVGRSWAERTTLISARQGDDELRPCIETRAVWVYVSLASGAPQPLPPEFFAEYGDGVRAHKVSARLKHAQPPDTAHRVGWPLRSTDFDALGHVNNAAYWEAVEDALSDTAPGVPSTEPRPRHAEIEFRGGIDPGERPALLVDRADGLGVWFVVGDDVRASARIS